MEQTDKNIEDVRYYKFLYSYIEHIKQELDNLDINTDPDEVHAILVDILPKYIWFSTGLVYPENYNNNGESLTPKELSEIYPDDWIEVTKEEFIECTNNNYYLTNLDKK